MPDTTVRQYRLLLPAFVEAVKLSPENLKWVCEWCRGSVSDTFDPATMTSKVHGLSVMTLHGIQQAVFGDYIVKKMNGDFRVEDAEDFEGFTPKYGVIS